MIFGGEEGGASQEHRRGTGCGQRDTGTQKTGDEFRGLRVGRFAAERKWLCVGGGETTELTLYSTLYYICTFYLYLV